MIRVQFLLPLRQILNLCSAQHSTESVGSFTSRLPWGDVGLALNTTAYLYQCIFGKQFQLFAKEEKKLFQPDALICGVEHSSQAYAPLTT